MVLLAVLVGGVTTGGVGVVGGTTGGLLGAFESLVDELEVTVVLGPLSVVCEFDATFLPAILVYANRAAQNTPNKMDTTAKTANMPINTAVGRLTVSVAFI